MAKLRNIHPGEVLEEEFLRPLGMTRYRLAKSIGVPPGRVGDIIRGKRDISPDTALRLAAFFGTSARFWLNLQADYDLEEVGRTIQEDLQQIPSFDQAHTVAA